jgi:hypothetical protein
MIIKLKNVLTIYISPDHNEKYHNRKIHMDNLLKKLGFTNIIHYKSSTEKYPFCLNNATIDIFSKYQPPFLLLEDDIDSNFDTIPDELNIPDVSDAFYLGFSKHGGHKYNNYNEGPSIFSHYNDELLKVENSLSAHAILYLSSSYIHNLRNLLITKPTFYNDVIMSQIQSNYNIYCYKHCYFYQKKELDGHEDSTKIIVYPTKSNITVTFVSAFLNINNCDTTKYFPYFERLAKSGVLIALFMDKNYKEFGEYIIKKYLNVKIIKYITIDDLYVKELVKNKDLPLNRNNQKDTKDYLTLINNKIYFVNEAMNINIYSTEMFSWIDFRIFHIFDDDQKIYNKLDEISVRKFTNQTIFFSGNLSNKNNIVDQVNWRYLGGFFIIDKNNIKILVNETTKILNNLDKLTWEVNIWGILEYENIFNFGWYYSDHNNSLILNL